jgi:hypothetical protein
VRAGKQRKIGKSRHAAASKPKQRDPEELISRLYDVNAAPLPHGTEHLINMLIDARGSTPLDLEAHDQSSGATEMNLRNDKAVQWRYLSHYYCTRPTRHLDHPNSKISFGAWEAGWLAKFSTSLGDILPEIIDIHGMY